MSNIIPIVSSSPPPYEDSQSFGWDDDDNDDDFGNFASAPSFSKSADNHSFDVDWSQVGDDLSSPESASKSSSPEKEVKRPSDQAPEGNECGRGDSDIGKACVENGDGGDEEDEFAGFTAFQDDKQDKPCVGSLPLQNTNQDTTDTDWHSGTNENAGSHTGIERSRESTTDSGLFSSDLSPVPKSDSASDCDKIVHSEEEETFPDLPQDVQGDAEAGEKAGVTSKENSCVNSAASKSHSLEECNEQSAATGDKEPRNESVKSGTNAQEDVSVCDESQASIPSSAVDKNTGEVEEGPKPDDGSCKVEEEDTPSDNNKQQSDEDDDWAGFETVSGEKGPSDDSRPPAEPGDLVLRLSSVEAEQQEEEGEDFGDFSAGAANSGGDSGEGDSCTDTVDTEPEISDSSTDARRDSKTSKTEESSGATSKSETDQSCDNSSRIPVAIEASAGKEVASSNDDDDFGDFSGLSSDIPSQVDSKESLGVEDSHSGNTSENVTTSDIPSSTELSSSTSGTDSSRKDKSSPADGEDEDEDEFGDFSGKTADEKPAAAAEFNAFSSGPTENAGDDFEDDDFGDFSGQTGSTVQTAGSGDTDDFSAFSANAVGVKDGAAAADDNADDDDFGDFSSQSAGPGASANDDGGGWAAFSSNSENKTEDDDDFGNFSEQPPQPSQETYVPSVSAVQHLEAGQGDKLEKAMSSCFPMPSQSSAPDAEEQLEPEEGTLGTILEYGLGYRSASQQTWQVVEHPSKRGPFVKLWHHLQDVDGSPAVEYQWLKSHGNSELFKTLHIDTRNMLIGHKKPSVPIFATGLSLLEPIRGGSRDRSDRGQPTKEPPPSLVDPNQQDVGRPTQDIPAVDFDWSTSGLTNPLTSKSLDLDFLVVQENDSSEKLTVFESELLDAPRSNVKPLQPLEEILKSVKPTSVRNRRDDSATSQMSEEAARVLSSLPDLSFMQSKVLMFPLKN